MKKKRKWITFFLLLFMISLGSFLIYYFYNDMHQPAPSRGVFVFHPISSGETNEYLY